MAKFWFTPQSFNVVMLGRTITGTLMVLGLWTDTQKRGFNDV